MPIDTARAKKHLHEFNFPALFVEELGWDKHKAQLSIPVDGQTFELSAVAEKRGLAAFVCKCGNGTKIPDYNVRRKIERQIAKSAHEHFIIFTDEAKTTQIWQWVRREAGKPAACREHHFDRGQSGEALIQKLSNVAFELAEEEDLTLIDVTIRARAGFDVEKVTKRFYERFQKEHGVFLEFIKGIPDEQLHRWYASVMLNRLMFIYFIQKKGFLNGDTNYLGNKLAASKPKDHYFSDFLCPLFFEGFAKKADERSTATNKLLGQVPYLNGGLFLRHQIEDLHGKAIQIPDTAFKRIFEFFEDYQWHLDERPLRNDKEINPDVLGYIFEKYINQKQMGAYYTKEDITEYISKNTIIPFLFDAARPKCKIAFEGEQSVWRLLQPDPDRYIYDAVKKGVDLELPSQIEAGLKDISKRTEWNRSASAEYALPTEIWREVVARRQRYEQVRKKLIAGETRDINDLITNNLNIRQFAQDVIENCEGPELLRAFWHAIENVTVLDPTCGSGAFLFAALNVLEPLYEACLDRMEAFVRDLERSGEKHRPEKFSDFRQVLDRIGTHPSRRYFIFKSIILNNLFGVDIMEEATEICKLRLFLKLVAQIDCLDQLEPLPDIDFNIRTGNTLVGYATRSELEAVGERDLLLKEDVKEVLEAAEDAAKAYEVFIQSQVEGDQTPAEFKHRLVEKFGRAREQCDRFLAESYKMGSSKKQKVFAEWKHSHAPFHWFVEFFGILKGGGFDVIIGNPPYVELSDIGGQYSIRQLSLVQTGNLYSLCIERFTQLLHSTARLGVIVPISSISTPRMLPLMQLIQQHFVPLHLSNFAVRPGKLFVGVDMNLTIVIGKRALRRQIDALFSSAYNRWNEHARYALFPNLAYAPAELIENGSAISKTGNDLSAHLLRKIAQHPSLARHRSEAPGADKVYYHSGGRYFRKCIREQLSNEYKPLSLQKGFADPAVCLLSSSLYYWFWIAISDCYHVTKRDIDAMPVPASLGASPEMSALATRLLRDLWKHAERRIRNRKDGSEQEEVNFHVGMSKSIIDEIDFFLAKHYGFSEEELDFIVNYDAKFRFADSAKDEE
ncbi:MAG TPA: SAM-dependent methyltransferase [Blastocatellia bacterium]|nr:SAM-dependent methyltransferase [Blastocatellia bacterium]